MAPTQFSKKQVYAVQTGDYAGQMFIIVEPNKDSVGCLSIPTMENVKVPFDALEHARNNDIIKYVEKLPQRIFKVSAAQYFKNENSNNRRKQLNTPNVSYSKTAVEENAD
tara:strand:- start:944 stop:1273 length:330 start_codon:yes stop_codon:yes gene_type:complete